MRKLIISICLVVTLALLIVPSFASTNAYPCDYCNGKYLNFRIEYVRTIRPETKVVNSVVYIRYLQEYNYYMLCTNNSTIGHFMNTGTLYTDWQPMGW
jgi:hypothetical protein